MHIFKWFCSNKNEWTHTFCMCTNMVLCTQKIEKEINKCLFLQFFVWICVYLCTLEILSWALASWKPKFIYTLAYRRKPKAKRKPRKSRNDLKDIHMPKVNVYKSMKAMVLLTHTRTRSKGAQEKEMRENCWHTILKRINGKGWKYKKRIRLESIFPKRINVHTHNVNTHSLSQIERKNKQKV